jgi:hypothetical protein
MRLPIVSALMQGIDIVPVALQLGVRACKSGLGAPWI